MIQQSLQNHLTSNNQKHNVATILTQVVVDKNDPGLQNPTKPVGPFYNKEQADRLVSEGHKMVEDAGRGFRKVVPSPVPSAIVEAPTIKNLLKTDTVVIACGGGGMPVYIDEKGHYEGIDGVVDKDLASSVLANEVEVDQFVILTGVDQVAVDFNKPTQRYLSKLTVSDAKKYLEEGQFPAGSMGPKIRSAIEFIERGGREVLITSPEAVLDAVQGKSGTRIVKG